MSPPLPPLQALRALEAASRRRSFSRAAEALHLTHSDFYDRHPLVDLALRMHAEVEPPDPYSVDVGIWHRRAEEPGFEARKLLDDQVVAVCHPTLLAHYPDFRIEQLPSMPLLRFTRRSWRDFFNAAGLDADEPTRGPIFDDSALLLQAALAGQGVCTTRLQLARRFIDRGELVQLGHIRIAASLVLTQYPARWSIIRVPPQRAADA